MSEKTLIDTSKAGYALIKQLSDDKDAIPYRKRLRPITGSVTATILLQQMVYLDDKKQGEPFYKFKSPCDHELYRDDDSWVEDLGFSIKEFDTALKKIGTKVTKGISKGEAYQKTDPTGLVIYWTDSDRVTWYHLNRDLLGKYLLGIYLESDQWGLTYNVPKGDSSNKSQKGIYPLTESLTKTPTENLSSSSTHAHVNAQAHERTLTHEAKPVSESKPNQEHLPPPHLNPAYIDPKSEYRATPPSRGESPAFDAVVGLWKGDNLGVISRTIERELWESMLDIEIHLSKHGVSGVGESAQAWLEYALKETAKQSKASWRYTETILANIKQAGSLARHIHNYEQGVSNGSGTTATRKSKTAGTPGEGRANGATAYLDRNREHIERFRQAKVR